MTRPGCRIKYNSIMELSSNVAMRITSHPLEDLLTPPEAYSCNWIFAVKYSVVAFVRYES
jgi:hypothetical protein